MNSHKFQTAKGPEELRDAITGGSRKEASRILANTLSSNNGVLPEEYRNAINNIPGITELFYAAIKIKETKPPIAGL